MPQHLSLFSLFMIGFLGGGHCMGMCGPLTSVFMLQLPKNVNRTKILALMNTGRIASYVIIGALLGGVGMMLSKTDSLQHVLFVVAHVLLIIMGLYLAGIAAWIVKVESIGRPVWRLLNPLFRRALNNILKIQSVKHLLAAGLLWGWLPCGLVYSASLYALSSGSAPMGALSMLAFGLGTLPNLLAVGLLSGKLKGYLQHKIVPLVTGLLVIAWGVWQLLTLVYPLG